MGRVTNNRRHRSLRAGVAIMPAGGSEYRGTLGAIARRKGTHVPVLVTNVHVIADHSTDLTLQGNEFVYQGGTDAKDRVAQLYTETDDEGNITYRSWVPQVERDAGPGSGWNVNAADIASAVLLANVPYTFDVHFPNDDHGDDDADHVKIPIVSPAEEPRKGMSVIAVGSTTEYRTPTINALTRGGDLTISLKDPNTGDIVARYLYDKNNIVILNQTGQDDGSDGGDSGSAYLWKDDDGNYRVVAIHFAGKRSRRSGESINGFAVSAKKVEELLDIYFGVKAPIADAGNDGQVPLGKNFSLDGRGSRAIEPGAKITSYKWEQPHKTVIPGSGTDTARPTFTAPKKPTTLSFKLTVTDSNGPKHSDTVTVTVNTPPIAVASAVPTASGRARVNLNGSSSKDPDGGELTYLWEFTGTQTKLERLGLVIKDDTSQVAHFFAPNENITLGFRLTVTDVNGGTASDTVTVRVKKKLADAGDDQTVLKGKKVTLGPQGASPSFFFMKPIYLWEQVGHEDMVGVASVTTQAPSMPKMTLHNKSGPNPWFNAPNKTGEMEFRLTVIDFKKGTDTDTVKIKVVEKPSTPASGQWDVRHSNGKIQFRVKSLPTVSPAVSQVRARLVAGISPNVTEVTKTLGTGLNTWVTALSSGDTKWQTGSWSAQIRFENSAGNSAYSATRSVTVPTPAPKPKPPTTPTPTPPPAPGTVTASATHNSVTITWSAVSGATSYVLQVGKMEEDEVVGYDDFATTSLTYTVGNLFSNTRYYYRVKSKNAAGEGTPSAAGSLITPVAPAPPTPPPPPVTPPTPWVDVSPPKYQGCGPSRKKQQTRVNNGVTEYRWVSASEPLKWGNWTDTGRTHYDDADGRLYKEQRRTSHCGDTETKWVVA